MAKMAGVWYGIKQRKAIAAYVGVAKWRGNERKYRKSETAAISSERIKAAAMAISISAKKRSEKWREYRKKA